LRPEILTGDAHSRPRSFYWFGAREGGLVQIANKWDGGKRRAAGAALAPVLFCSLRMQG